MSLARSERPARLLGVARRELLDTVNDEARLGRLIRRLGLVALLLLVVFVAFYGFDRYLVLKPSPQEAAIQQMEDAVRRTPTDATLRLQIAGAYAQQRHYDQAVAQFGEALKLRPDWQIALLGMAGAELARHNDARAEELYRQVADMNSKNDFRFASRDLQLAYLRLGQLAEKGGRHDEAAEWAKDILKGDSANADALFLLGTAQEEQGHNSEARDAYRQAVALDPNFQQALGGLERVAQALGDQNEAGYAHGMALLAGGDAAAAQAAFEQLIAKAPDYAEGYQGLGLAYGKEGRRDEAIKAFHDALNRDANLVLSQWSVSSLEGSR